MNELNYLCVFLSPDRQDLGIKKSQLVNKNHRHVPLQLTRDLIHVQYVYLCFLI